MAHTTPAIMETAGLSAKVYGRQVSILAQNRSYMLNWSKRYIFEPGQAFYIPKITKRTITSAATQPATDLTFNAIGGTKAQMTNQWAYDGVELQISALEAMTPEQLRATMEGVKESAGDGMAADVDAAIFATYAEWTAGPDVALAAFDDVTELRTAIKQLRAANAPGPYFGVFHEELWDELDSFTALNQFQIRGDSPMVEMDAAGLIQFIYKRVRIGTTNNIQVNTTPTPDDYENVVFAGAAFGVAIRSFIQMRQAFDIRDATEKLLIYSDYAYDVVEPTYAISVKVDIS